MEVVNAEVDWMLPYSNSPRLKVLVDKLPDHRDVLFQTHKSGKQTAYYAHTDGYVRFFVHNPGDESGYGGSVFTGKRLDGTEFSVKGPWSSRAGAMNRIFQPHCLDVSITDDREVWERGHTFFAGNISLPLAIEAAKKANVWLAAIWDGEDLRYDPVMHRSYPKGWVSPSVGREASWCYVYPPKVAVDINTIDYDKDLLAELADAGKTVPELEASATQARIIKG